MLKLLLILLLASGAVIYFKTGHSVTMPQSLPQLNISAAKDKVVSEVYKYFPETATQSMVLGSAIKNDGLSILLDQVRKLSPADYKTLQQFVCAPK